MTFALLLELTQHAGHHSQTVRDAMDAQSRLCCWTSPIELEGLTLGIVGFGESARP
jgi:lactate dehydrogenase-like 2-hydroxyacid dehydrogenase